MKGEYVEQDETTSSSHHQPHHSQHQQHPQHYTIVASSTTITNSHPQNANSTPTFPKFLSPPPHFISPHSQSYPQHPQHHHQYVTENNEITPHNPQHHHQYVTENNEITPHNQTPPTKKPKTATPNTSEDGATIEVSRRRGRPPGSKNKPKPPVIITREPEPGMSPYIFELPSGSDIVDSLTRFTHRRGVGLCILTASGAVSNVSLKQPSTTTGAPGGTVPFHGRFDILSLSACLMTQMVPFNVNGGGFSISLAGPQGQIVGGKVVGSLICAGIVYVVATSFNSPSFCRLPLEDAVQNHHHQSHQQQQQQSGGKMMKYDEDDEVVVQLGDDRVTCGDVQGGNNSGSPVSGGGEGDVSIVGRHMRMYSGGGGDVIWAPTPARPQQQPPY